MNSFQPDASASYQRLAQRHRAERRFLWMGRLAVGFGISCVVLLFTDIISKGIGAFTQTTITMPLEFDAQELGLTRNSSMQQIKSAEFGALFKNALRTAYPEAESRAEKKQLYGMFTADAPLLLRNMVLSNPAIIGSQQLVTLIADDKVDLYYKHSFARGQEPESELGRLTGLQKSIIARLHEQGAINKRFNTLFFTSTDSREPELAGIRGAIAGSALTLLVTLVLSFPIAVATAVYLEEFAPANRFTEIIEININNLAAVPSVIFGLLGLAVFINIFGMPRSVPLVGGLVLTLMTLPTIIISSRAALRAVPRSIREAALGMGASRVQTVIHHVLPSALPGMLTGTIIGMAQALGETAPLLMIGMVAFIVDVPTSITDPATALPVQIFLWSDNPEQAFVEKTSAAIMVLLTFLIFMNGFAVWLRRRLERRW